MAYEETMLASEAEYRTLYTATYCDIYHPILTFDDIHVKFFPETFDHAFFESKSRRAGNKSVFCHERAKRILWIKEALNDPDCILKKGWDKEKKEYNDNKRVAIIKGNYVVVIVITGFEKARFITAYVADNSIDKILGGEDWICEKKKER